MEDRPFRLLPFRGNSCGLIPYSRLDENILKKADVLVGNSLIFKTAQKDSFSSRHI